MSFSVKPNLGTRKGWKIMPESGEPDPEMLQRVIDMIHEMEFSGELSLSGSPLKYDSILVA